jgi:mono/diheme cytochrome c family protein
VTGRRPPRTGAALKVIAVVLAVAACQEEQPAPAGGLTLEAMGALSANEVLPDSLADGRASFETFCIECHGPAATGSEKGPPLVNRVYHPGHHADPAFFLAPVQGVRAHHWRFGDMPPVEGITRDQVGDIIAYVRWLQRQVGIF